MRPLSVLTLLFSLTAFSAEAGPCVPNVESSFHRIHDDVVPLTAWTHNVFSRGSYRQLLKTRFGLDNHIQGIVRIPGTSAFILSGGDRYIKEANLFFIDLPSTNGDEIIAKNFWNKNGRDASVLDGFIQKLDIGSKDYWHAGGVAILDKLLAVPIENPKTKMSKIMFFDVTDQFRPVKIDVEIERKNSTTGSVLFYRSSEGKLIVGGNVNGKMEFFESKTTDIKDGFQEASKHVMTAATGQGTDIITQCDGKIFLIDFNNTSKFAPIIPGKNYIRLFTINPNDGTSTLLSKRILDTKRNCNFKAAGSHHVTEDGKLVLYGSSFYRHFAGKQFKMCQFSE